MIALLTFSLIAAGFVLLAGRKDTARDPRLTFSLLMLMALLPVMGAFLPKFGVLPSSSVSAEATGFPWMAVFASVCAIGSLAALARLAWAAVGLNRWRKRAHHVATVDGVSICELAGLRGPVAAGILRRVVFVPQTWKDWPEEERRMVLGHELAHHRRRDPLWLLCAELARAALWFHPLAHWMAKRFSLQCEYACDEVVIRSGTNPRRYASLLCDFAEKRANTPFALAMADSSSLEKRVERMFKPAGRAGVITFVVLGMLGVASACALSMIGNAPSTVDETEVQLRLSADPFPGER